MNKRPPIISVTGTKGKTTVVNVVDSVLRYLGKNTLKVDTTGHYVNGEQRSTLDESKAYWQLVPTVCPGRYLWEFFADEALRDDSVAVLECALGSSAAAGLGYREHEIGVFLNVYSDHLGSSDRLKTREDIARAKSFVFKRIANEGYAVFNADDELVCKTLEVIDEAAGITRIPCGVTFAAFDIDRHLESGGSCVTCEGTKIVYKSKTKSSVIADMKNIPWAFAGEFMPSKVNLLHVVGALAGYFKGDFPENITEALEQVRLDPYGGRLTLLQAQKGTTILADYAHEKESLAEVAHLAKQLTRDNGRVIGVVRLAHDRTDDLITETGKIIGQSFDELVVYDKIDGHLRKPKQQRGKRFPQVVGRTSQVLADAIATENEKVTRIIREDEALSKAAEIAGPDDVVVCIVNDDIHQSIGFIRASFKADFV